MLKTKLQNLNLKATAKKHWKLGLVCALVLGVATAGVVAVKAHDDHEDRYEYSVKESFGDWEHDREDGDDWSEDREDRQDWSDEDGYDYDGLLSLTYEDWKKAVNASSLSSSEKDSFLKALEASKTNIDKLAKLDAELEKIYTDKLTPLETEYSKLVDKNKTFWDKLYANTGDRYDYRESLDDWDAAEVAETKAEIKASSLTAAEKETLTKEVDAYKALYDKWITAYEAYATKEAETAMDYQTTQNAIITSFKDNKLTEEMIANVISNSSLVTSNQTK